MTAQEESREAGWTVVLADDNDDHAHLIRRALERAVSAPVEVIRARNGDEAMDCVQRRPPDLLLLDLNMPGRSGHEVLQRIKGDDRLRRIPVAVLTSSDRDEDVARSYGLGGNHFITKPGDPRELEKRLRTLMDNLAELKGVRRGAGSVPPSGVSALDPARIRFRRHLPFLGFAVVLMALLAFAYLTGIF